MELLSHRAFVVKACNYNSQHYTHYTTWDSK